MSRETLMKPVMERINGFHISEESIFHIIELSDRRKELPAESFERYSAYLDLHAYLRQLEEQDLQELMCLMDFGRNLSYCGFTRDVAEEFAEKVDARYFSHIRGKAAADYLAGKVPLGEWCRVVLKEVRAESLPDDFYRLVLWGSEDETLEFQSADEAWKALRDAMKPETAEKYHGISLTGYSLTGRAETKLAVVNLMCD